MDPRIWPKPTSANAFRIRRMTGPGEYGDFLSFGTRDDGEPAIEWAIVECTAATLLDRWGPGVYGVELFRISTDGTRQSKGRSGAFRLEANGAITRIFKNAGKAPPPPGIAYDDAPPAPAAAEGAPAAPPRPSPPPSPSESSPPPPRPAPGPFPIEPGFAMALQLMNVVNAQVAAQTARILEQERIAAKERAEQQQQFYQAMMAMALQANAKPAITADDIRGIIRDELDDWEDEKEAAENESKPAQAAQPPGEAVQIVQGFKDIVQTVAPMLSSMNGAAHRPAEE